MVLGFRGEYHTNILVFMKNFYQGEEVYPTQVPNSKHKPYPQPLNKFRQKNTFMHTALVYPPCYAFVATNNCDFYLSQDVSDCINDRADYVLAC